MPEGRNVEKSKGTPFSFVCNEHASDGSITYSALSTRLSQGGIINDYCNHYPKPYIYHMTQNSQIKQLKTTHARRIDMKKIHAAPGSIMC